MKRLSKFLLLALGAAAAAGLAAVGIAACGIVVGPGELLVATPRMGAAAGAGAEPAGRVLGPGRHFVNPLTETWERHPAIHVSGGGEPSFDALGRIGLSRPPEIGVVTALFGLPLPEGEFLAGPSERGIQRAVLTPGSYLLDPRRFRVDLFPATSVPAGHVGVVTHLAGRNTESELAGPDERGVQAAVLAPGIYFLNPFEFQVTPVRVGFSELTFEGPSAVAFPAADSNVIRVDATIVWGVDPTDAPHVIRQFGSLALVVERLIRPQIESVMRLSGSGVKARQFIEGASRRAFQQQVEAGLKAALEQKHVRVLLALIQNVEVPDHVKKPVQDGVIAEELDLTHRAKLAAAADLRALNEATAAVEEAAARARGETDKRILETFAAGKAEAQRIATAGMLEVARVKGEAERLRADAARRIALAENDVARALGAEDVRGLGLRLAALGGTESAALWTFAEKLSGSAAIAIRPGALGSGLEEALREWLAKD